MLDQVIDSIVSYGGLQWAAFFFNVAYVVLAARQNIWCWFFGAVGVTLLFVICIDARLFSDALLQVFYLGMSIYGWVQWHRGTIEDGGAIITLPFNRHLPYIALGLLGTLMLGLFWSLFDAVLPYIDACTTSFSIIATYLVARKVLENWWYWIAIDVVCFFVYLDRALPVIAGLFFIFTLLAIYGWISWRRSQVTAAIN